MRVVNGINAGTKYPYDQQTYMRDRIGRVTKYAFKSENRTGYLNLDTYQLYTYDPSKHRLTQVQREASATEKAQAMYDDATGRVTKVIYGTGARTEYAYDASHALTRIYHYSAGGTLLAGERYAFDEAGNVGTKYLDDGLGDTGQATVTYLYDDLYRLTREFCQPAGGSARQPYGYEYWYDAVGNRTRADEPNGVVVDATYNAWDQLVSETDRGPEPTTRAYQYDAYGNLARCFEGGDLKESYAWSDSNELLRATLADGRTIHFTYDASGTRTGKSVAGGTETRYLTDSANPTGLSQTLAE